MSRRSVLYFALFAHICPSSSSSHRLTHGLHLQHAKVKIKQALNGHIVIECDSFIVLCPKLGEFLPLISAKYAAPTPHRERKKRQLKKRNCLLN